MLNYKLHRFVVVIASILIAILTPRETRTIIGDGNFIDNAAMYIMVIIAPIFVPIFFKESFLKLLNQSFIKFDFSSEVNWNSNIFNIQNPFHFLHCLSVGGVAFGIVRIMLNLFYYKNIHLLNILISLSTLICFLELFIISINYKKFEKYLKKGYNQNENK